MKIVTKLDSFKGDRPFEAWIRRIMINTIIDDYRKNSKEKSIIQFKDIQNDGTENSWVEYNAADLKFEAEELLALLIGCLPKVKKYLFFLRLTVIRTKKLLKCLKFLMVHRNGTYLLLEKN